MKKFLLIMLAMLIIGASMETCVLASSTDDDDVPSISKVSPSSGYISGGTKVTITGDNFTDVTGVSFGGVEVESYKVESASTITLKTPTVTTAEKVKVTVTTENGSDSKSNGFKYIEDPVVTSISPSSGYTDVKTDVTITGENFTDDIVEVTFDGEEVSSFEVISSTKITAVAPKGETGSAIVRVVTSGGYASAGHVKYKYTFASSDSDELPVVTSVSPSSGSVTGGTVVTITGRKFNDTKSVTFGSTKATSFTVESTTTITAVVPESLTTGTVDVSVENSEGMGRSYDAFTYQSTKAYGSWEMLSLGKKLSVAGGEDIIFTSGGTMNYFSHDVGTSTFTVEKTGQYVVDFGVNVSSGYGAQIALKVNDLVVDGTGVNVLNSSGEVTGTSILSLSSGDVVTLSNNSDTELKIDAKGVNGAWISFLEASDSYGYGYKVADSDSTSLLGGADLTFSEVDPISGLTQEDEDTDFTIDEDGNYIISFNVNLTDGQGGAIAIAVNGDVVESTSVEALASSGNLAGSAILSLESGDTVSLRNNSETTMSLDTSSGVSAQMSIVENNQDELFDYINSSAKENTIDVGDDISFSKNSTDSSGIKHLEGGTEFTVESKGIYIIKYGINCSDGDGGELSLTINGTEETETSTDIINESSNIIRTVILDLDEGDVITLQNTSEYKDITIGASSGVGAFIQFIGLSD